LSDDQLADLFSMMKKETMAKREKENKEMQKFKFDAGDDDGEDGLLEELGGLEDSEEEEVQE
jgi:hypothetical protein